MILTTGCPKSTWEEQEQRMISDYIRSLGDTAYVLYPSGLYYIELQEGTGAMPTENDTVYFRYEAQFLNYVTFDVSGPDSIPLKYPMGIDTLVKGVDEGLKYMKEGGVARLLTPSSLAFGFEGIWQIVPGYTPIIWTIALDSVIPGPKK
jgi:peptidylprolyl isomerase